MSDINSNNLTNPNGLGNLITIGDVIALFDLILPDQPLYLSKWNVITKGEVISSCPTSLLGNNLAIKTEANLLIENLGDRVTVYNIEAFFLDTCHKKRISATNLLVHAKDCMKNDFIVLDKGDVRAVKIIALLLFQEKSIPRKSIKELELVFHGTGKTISKIFSLNR